MRCVILPAADQRVLPNVFGRLMIVVVSLDDLNNALDRRVVEPAQHAREIALIDSACRVEFHEHEER